MANVVLTLPNQTTQEVPQGTTVAEAAQSISPRLARTSVCARYNDQLIDMSTPLTANGTLELYGPDSPEGIETLRHTAAHVMAQAVLRLWPNTLLAIGPTIDKGFYYDFDSDHTFSPDDLATIEEQMQAVISEDLPITREVLSHAEAETMFSRQKDLYKLELIADMEEPISIYRQGEFLDLCRGPHLPSTGYIKAFKLLSIAGAYWRGDANRPMLQRIYGTAFPKKKELNAHLKRLEEAARRDHRKIGRELDLFSIQEEGPGFPFFHPKGMVLKNTLLDFWRNEHQKRGYEEVSTPILLQEDLWHRSGHWDHYRENMYFTEIDEQRFAIKPMNCPGGMLLYKRRIHSYRDLPLRMAELGLVHRHELSGTLHGLMRARNFTQDDAHIFMLPSQIEAEIGAVMDFVDYVYAQVFDLDYHVELSTRPDGALGDEAIWNQAITALQNTLEQRGTPYQINPGDGAFYGPKIDFHLEDCLGRTWQCSTIQLDFMLPERFDLTYIGEDGEKHRPVMLHRVIFGALERFIAILTEHFAGAFPLWLAPVQAAVMPVSDEQLAYAREIQAQLQRTGLRVELDARPEKIGYKIRQAQLQQIPYMLVLGAREQAADTITVRHRRKGDLGTTTLAAFQQQAAAENSAMCLE